MPSQPFPPPRTWLEEPGVFGKGSGKAKWKSPDNPKQVIRIRAARFHHKLAIRVRRRIQDHRTSVSAIADQIGVSDDMINDALNGITHLNITTLDAIANSLGLTLKVEFEDPREKRADADGPRPHPQAGERHQSRVSRRD